jgi:omega-3 fatty acid desaturase (delta-15 desaturase)
MESIRNSIPKECFEINTMIAIYYWARDMIFISALAYMYSFLPLISSLPLYLLAKFAWWNCMGFLGWCLFVIGHDCGHGTFSPNTWINSIFGTLSHAPLLVPYHGWRISHRAHHMHHNHVDKDHSWRPMSYSLWSSWQGNDIWSRIAVLFRLTHFSAWLYPFYLMYETSPLASGNHFNPYSKLFKSHERLPAASSTLACLLFLAIILYSMPFLTFLDAYFVPYLIFVFWLDVVTHLHHTDPDTLYYREGEWSFLHGAISTIDRSYGWIIDHLHHNIGTHVLHHMYFTKIPHYNLVKATAAVRPLLGEYYRFDSSPVFVAWWKNVRMCQFVSDEGKVVKYQPAPIIDHIKSN